ncbi:hypothetical protein AB205_0200410 [Aquarana catesbeiana]|uniref:Uncharacterized protein n=1 Tax=Aquarana catesbeiana TaxID=8400 RepID=A0A2G9Q6K0_AQUCT|nr:hypothetical protein AB205_0200410 [Aquarana catesbeiana]
MAETQQVSDNYTNKEEESPEPETSQSRKRRFRASNMSFGEMLEMVDILKGADYDGKYGPYPNPNVRKAKIMAKVVKREKRLGGHHSPMETTDPPPQEEVEIPQSQQEEEEEEGDVVELVTTTGDRDVVDPGHFTSESAQIGEIMGCNRDLENIQKNINDVKKK